MMRQQENINNKSILAEEYSWSVNIGKKKIQTKRMKGRFRRIKWLTSLIWLFFFFGPYFRWDDRQAVLFDIGGRQFHLFGVTVYPYDIWMLSFILLFFAMLLTLTTVLIGRAFCGYFCFQTIWTDLFNWVEEKLEGPPRKRVDLDAASWGPEKLTIKMTKHSIWLIISMLTGISFAAWFTDAYQLWVDYFNLQAHISAWIVLILFTAGTYVFAGFMREQVCLWLCPYARIQSALYDNNTLIPTYDTLRGEPRAKWDRDLTDQPVGCVDCNQCVAVCPTGVDIREGEHIGCITCGLCIDACDHVMDKINQPRGLIRYDSISNNLLLWYQRPQIIASSTLLFVSVFIVFYGLSNLSDAELMVSPKRQPAYVLMSDGKIQNTYHVKIFNKSKTDSRYHISIDGFDGMVLSGNEKPLHVQAGNAAETMIYVKIPKEKLTSKLLSLTFRINSTLKGSSAIEYQSVFMTP